MWLLISKLYLLVGGFVLVMGTLYLWTEKTSFEQCFTAMGCAAIQTMYRFDYICIAIGAVMILGGAIGFIFARRSTNW
jgi:hypothetical protein